MLIDALKVLKFGLANPVSRNILKFGMKMGDNGKYRLELALDDFCKGEMEKDLLDKIYSWGFSKILSFGCHVFRTNPESFREYLKNPIIQRGITNVLSGIAEYGVTKPQVLKAPFLIVWNFTNLCNLNCKHCYQYAGKEISDANELELDEKLNLINELADVNVVSIAFSGGEPLIHKDFFTVLREAKRKGMFTAVATNGTLINEDMAKRLKEYGADYVEISLDFPRPDLHDDFRGISGAFERTINGIKNCVKEDIFTCIATTVTKANLS